MAHTQHFSKSICASVLCVYAHICYVCLCGCALLHSYKLKRILTAHAHPAFLTYLVSSKKVRLSYWLASLANKIKYVCNMVI